MYKTFANHYSATQAEWDAAIEKEIAAGRTRQQAVINVSRKYPALRAQLLAAANSR